MNERKEISVLTTLKEFLGLAIKLHKPYLAALAFSSIILTVQTVFHASQLSILLFYLQKRQFRQALLCGVFLAAVGFCLSAAGKWDNRLLKVHQAKLGETFGHYIFGKVSRIPYFCLEDPECLDLLERARFNVTNENCIRAVLTGLANIVQYVLTLISLAAFLAAFDYRLFGILLIAVFLNIILFRFFSKERLEFSDANVDINRKFVYYTNTLLDYENGKDFRMYRLGGFMKKKFNYFTDKMVTYYNRYLRRTDVIKTLMQVVKYLEMMGIYCFMIAKTIGGGLSVALLTLYISVASNFSTTVSSLIQSSMSFYIGLRLAMPVVQLARLPEETTETEGITLEEFQTLEFRDVVFRYPRSEQKILDHVSFRINKGETISIVGMNGAGKAGEKICGCLKNIRRHPGADRIAGIAFLRCGLRRKDPYVDHLLFFVEKRNFAANAQTRLNCNMYSFFQEKIACNENRQECNAKNENMRDSTGIGGNPTLFENKY